jgi:opacity protein-like surface antigen
MYRIFIICILLSGAAFSQTNADLDKAFRYPWYLGIEGGYGSTTWQGLVPSAANQNMALSISTPIFVEEGGGVWGFFAGYEFSRYLAIEANYMFYPHANIQFDKDSLFAFEHNGETMLKTQTQTGSIMGKVMLVIPHTLFRLYSGAGVAMIKRKDPINENQQFSPTFGVGINYNFTPHIMGEIGSNYTAGYGESELNPAKDYVPFLYSIFLRLAIRA